MNRVFKVVWNKAKNCYVVASELAKRRTKEPSLVKKTKIVNLSLAITLLLHGGLLISDTGLKSAEAAITWWTSPPADTVDFLEDGGFDDENGDIVLGFDGTYLYAIDNDAYINGRYTNAFKLDLSSLKGSSDAITGLSVSGKTITYTKADGTKGTITTQDNDTKYTAGNGLALSGTTFSAKAGTNVTVNASGISVTGNGSVASGNTGLIDGGKLYSEVRPSGNGNYVMN